MEKLYVVVRSGGTSMNLILGNLKGVEYAGTSLSMAKATYRKLLRWCSTAKMFEIGLGESKEYVPDESLNNDVVATKVLKDYEDFVRGLPISMSRRMVKNGKVSISFYYTEAKYKNPNDYSYDESATRKALYMVTKYFIKSNDIKVPFKIKVQGYDSEQQAYNQK